MFKQPSKGKREEDRNNNKRTSERIKREKRQRRDNEKRQRGGIERREGQRS